MHNLRLSKQIITDTCMHEGQRYVHQDEVKMPQAFPTKNWVPRLLVLKYSRETHMIPRRLVIVKVQKLPR